MIDLDEILEALEDCRDRELEFLDTCERVARKFNVPQTFKESLESGRVLEPKEFVKGLLEAREAYEKALQNEGFRKTRVLGSPLSGGIMACATKKEN